ncbi:VanW family protein [Oceanobacillus locisalsi]|uniref:VanW family protein n=1 Tax=Oceanobacillus locisalsi TaxID=546107 RepID=A0ABW3NFV9_9BACI
MYWFKRRTGICLIMVITFVLFGVPSVVMAGKVSDGSSIGSVSLENLTIEEAEEKMEEVVTSWQNGVPLLAENAYETIEIPRSVFHFDVESSMNQLEDRMARSWTNFFKKPQNVQQRLLVSISEEQLETLNLPERIDIDQTMDKALIQAKNLSEKTIPLTYMDEENIEQEDIAAVNLDISDMSPAMVRLIAQNIDGRLLESDQIFSLLDDIDSVNGLENEAGELSFVASGLYQLALQSNMEIIERHAQSHIAGYAEAGLDAEVSLEEEMDLQLYNPGDSAYTLQADVENNMLQLSLQAMVAESEFEYSIENRREIAPRKVYRYNSNLADGEEHIVQQGQSGISVEVYRISKEQGNTVTGKDLVGQDFYPPTPEVVEVAVSDPDEEIEEVIIGEEEYPDSEDTDDAMDRIYSDFIQSEQLCEEGEEACIEAVESLEQEPESSLYALLLYRLLLEMTAEEHLSDELYIPEEGTEEEEIMEEGTTEEDGRQVEESEAELPVEQFEENIEKMPPEEEIDKESETEDTEGTEKEKPEEDTEEESDCVK